MTPLFPPLFLAIALAAPATAQEAQPAHWAVVLGKRVHRVNVAFPVVDQVVLVPDAGTYVRELSRWSPRGRWPVLLEDDRLAPMFIRRFGPARVIRREPAEAGGHTPKDLEAVIVRTWGGEPGRDSIQDVFTRAKHVPPGVVIASINDPGWTAAVALGAGRGQPIGWLDERFGPPNRLMNQEALVRLLGAVDDLVAAGGHPFAALGDAIETITVCLSMPGRADVAAAGEPDVRAVTDLLGRRDDGGRYAFAGWIFGDEARCAYTAMCSLFLPRTRLRLVNTYPAEGAWQVYGIDGAAAVAAGRGFEVRPASGERAGLQPWLGQLAGGWSGDVVVMNSKGNADFFELADGRAYPGDVPVLNEPMAVHFTHSWSFRSPSSPGTVGGRWLQRGAYAYVGSTNEPTLGAFLPPAALVVRWTAGVPFLVGARHWDAAAWKVATFGDPLMLCPPPGVQAPGRVPPPDDGSADLTAHAAALMRGAASDEEGQAFAEAIRTLDLLGRDEIAVEMWHLAARRGLGSPAAAPALGPLFRTRRVDQFVAAWEQVTDRDAAATDMLWHLLTPRLGGADQETLLLLSSAVRAEQPEADLERLAPHLIATVGAGFTRNAIQRELERASRPRTKRELRRLLDRYTR